jgi:hypothetical protein
VPYPNKTNKLKKEEERMGGALSLMLKKGGKPFVGRPTARNAGRLDYRVPPAAISRAASWPRALPEAPLRHSVLVNSYGVDKKLGSVVVGVV